MNRFAEEKWKNRFTTAAKENYNEMGLLTFSVVFYTLKNGQQAVDMYVYSSCSGVIRSLSQVFSHDNISEILGIPCKSFREMHKRGFVYPDSTRRCRNRTSYRKENYDYRVKSGRFSDCSGSGILGKNDESRFGNFVSEVYNLSLL